VCGRASSPNVQAYGHPVAAWMPLKLLCPESLYCMWLALCDAVMVLHHHNTGFKLLMTLYHERQIISQMCKGDEADYLHADISALL